MPLKVPTIDDRSYQELLTEALARVPVHTPEWTNFQASDPGVTLVEVFAFLTESLLYRANQIPERNRLKFLSLLGIPLAPATAAEGLVAFSNERRFAGVPDTPYLAPGLELRAGQVPYVTTRGVTALPIEARAYGKRRATKLRPEVQAHYDRLYTSIKIQKPGSSLAFYETVAIDGARGGFDLSETVDGCLWIALLLRDADKPSSKADAEAKANTLRQALAGQVLSLGLVLATSEEGVALPPAGRAAAESAPPWTFKIPKAPKEGLPQAPDKRVPDYRTVATIPAPSGPTVVEIPLPDAADLALWPDIEPAERGTGDFPPSLEDTTYEDQQITWIRIIPPAGGTARILWAGINVAPITQRARVTGEFLPDGTGEPEQTARLSRAPVLALDLALTVNGEAWQRIDDLSSAGPEIALPDPRLPPGSPTPPPRPSKVFVLDAESGEVRFGDGLRGARPPRGAKIRADYAHALGRAGNVAAGAIRTGPALPTGIRVTNPVSAWGGADAESVRDGEKQIARFLQHRDRLVTAADFETISLRTPGVSIGRVDVLPAWHPERSIDGPGDAPGVVTLLVIPRHDAVRPHAPIPDRAFLEAVAAWLEPRRLVTTEIALRGPTYKDVWVSLGVRLHAGARSLTDVLRAVEEALRRFLSPLPDPEASLDERGARGAQGDTERRRGWPLRQAVYPLELAAVASRVPGVAWVSKVLLADGDGNARDVLSMQRLELPRLARLSVTAGDAVPIDQLRGAVSSPSTDISVVPVPVVPEEC